MPSTRHSPFPVRPLKVFLLFGVAATTVAFLPPPLDLLPNIKLFFREVFGVHAKKGAPPPELNEITSSIAKLEATLPKSTATTPPPSSAAPAAPTPVKTGALMPLVGARPNSTKRGALPLLQIPCLKGSLAGCKRWALSHFFSSLERTSAKKKTTRITYYGDSIISLDKVTSTLREKFQHRFGASGPGFFHMAALWKWTKHKEISLHSREWKTESMLNPKKRQRLYGYGGILAHTIGPGATTRLRIREEVSLAPITKMEVYYARDPEGGKFHVKVDKRVIATVDTRGTYEGGQKQILTFPQGHDFAVVAGKGGVLKLTGVVLENETKGVVVDSISMTGGRLIHFANMNPAHQARTITQRAPDLLIFHFGINEADTGLEPDYQERALRFLRNIRKANPALSCLIAGPSDKVTKRYGEYVTKPIIHHIIKVQLKIAHSAGCAFFDTWRAMGGEASIVKWYNHRPRLAIGDLTHITDAGGALLGSLLYLELMKGYSFFLKEQR